MSSQLATAYVLPDGPDAADDDGWISPRPVDDVVREAVLAATPLTDEDLDPIESYVDAADLQATVNGPSSERIAFDVEAHEVVVTDAGDVRVDE